MEQEAYYQIHGWGWLWFAYFLGILVTFMYAVFTMDDITFSKKKKFSWSAMLIALIFTAFSWFGFAALMKFDKKNYDKYNRN
jgi:hypothetical protein